MIEKRFYFSGCDLSPGLFTRPAAFARAMQFAAEQDLDAFDLSAMTLRKLGLAFVLSKISVSLTSPAIKEIRVKTFSREIHAMTFFRDFVFTEPNGTPAGCAISRWALIHVDSRTLAPPSLLPKSIPSYPELAVDLDAPRFARKLPPEALDLGLSTVYTFQTDANAHLNNCAYFDLCIEKNGDLPYKQFAIEYLSEVRLHDSVRLYRTGAPEDCVLYGANERTGTLSFIAYLAV